MSHRITKKKIKMFLKLRFRKEPMMMYDSTLDVGKLQANTYDTIYNIEREIDNE